ncbi:MAG: acyl carrier protein [Gemmatimonas sp.]
MTETMQTVKDFILKTFLPGEDPSALTETTPLITSGILDSLATLDLVAFLEKQYGLEFSANEVDVSRLGTLTDIARIVETKRAASGKGA